jgi:hypothetical protein
MSTDFRLRLYLLCTLIIKIGCVHYFNMETRDFNIHFRKNELEDQVIEVKADYRP